MSTPQLPALVNLSAYHGDTWTQTFRLKQGTVPVDLTGATVAAWAQHLNGTIVPLGTRITNPTGGELELSAAPGGLPSGSHTYDVEIRQGSVVRTWLRGALTVTADITNPALTV